MRVAAAVLTLLLAAGSSFAQSEPVYLDQLMEMPLAELQPSFPGLKKDGCYRIAEERYIHIEIDKKDQKPRLIVLSNVAPCRRAETGPAIDARLRSGVNIGDTQLQVIERLGRPDTANPPEHAQRKLGETEFFYICRVSPECARHTSVFLVDGRVTAVSEWYSE
jgi:hypothetical protein